MTIAGLYRISAIQRYLRTSDTGHDVAMTALYVYYR